MERWDKINAVQKMQDYVETHLHEPITLKNLADTAGYSPWHAAKIFKELLGKTPFEYIRALRLSKAAMVLRDGGEKVVDVAFDFVFDTHEGFTRAFSKEFGISPKRYSKEKKPVNLFMPSRIRDYYLMIQKGDLKMEKERKASTVFVQVVERPERKLILLRGIKATHYFEYCEEVGCDVWGILSSISEALFEPAGFWLPKHLITEGTSQYVQGVEVPMDYQGEVPDGFDVITLPPCKMMIFQGEPYEDEKFGEAIEDLWKVMNDYDPKLYGFTYADEDGPRFQLEPQGFRGYIEGRPVRSLLK
ncbi:AraC family transcriptional regulator [Proteiniclasticum sp.]|uniref:AraC family transcriptional regulator n=1 Tax=Proteiniclasticum sp. TaxID=2053595 RepID=UPI00289AF2BF|nr:AraC family transcriptional regulator [Proteiniclasticum sp.]